MNKESRETRHRTSSIRLTATAIGVAYLAAMTALVLSEVGVITDDIWLYLSMGGALIAALCGFFFGYALAVTAEARSYGRTGREDLGSSDQKRTNEDSPVGELSSADLVLGRPR